jgi:FixJ family two-component response regulator
MSRTSLPVAIVDDEESVRRALKRLLRSAGMEVETFSSGSAFLEAARAQTVACVVLDLHMAGLSGFETQARLLRLGKWVPVIIMTGHDAPDSRTRALAGGAVAYLLKPVDGQLLIDTIETAIAGRQR